jgi:hypothetical protein
MGLFVQILGLNSSSSLVGYYISCLISNLFVKCTECKQLHFLLGCEEVSTVPSLVAYLQHSATGVDEDGQHNL